jgi:GT2 family glycosyltransferase
MARTLVGICAYGGLKFLKLGIEALKSDPGFDKDFHIFVVVGKPNDREMEKFLRDESIITLSHSRNCGFAWAINDMYLVAFVHKVWDTHLHGEYDNLIIMGNDVIPVNGAVSEMIRVANETDYEMVCGSEFNSRFLYDNYPEVCEHFEGPNLIVKDSAIENRVWELHRDFRNGIEPDTRKDIRNLTLFKRSVFEKVGYADVNFWPNAYFEDNDYGRKCDLLGITACGLKEAPFFHWWSRTKNEGESRPHETYYDRNRVYYTHKWHGEPGAEKLDTPFGGGPYTLGGISVPCDMKIASRDHEAACIEYWSSL